MISGAFLARIVAPVKAGVQSNFELFRKTGPDPSLRWDDVFVLAR